MDRDRRLWLWAGPLLLMLLMLLMPLHSIAQEQRYLMGFVERLCIDEARCFILKVEAEYQKIAGEQLVVRFDNVTRLYDPENYQLTLAQQRIVPGSHLRLQLSSEAGQAPKGYRAIIIWIGD